MFGSRGVERYDDEVRKRSRSSVLVACVVEKDLGLRLD